VNGTVALMGSPITYSIARALEIEPKIMFLLAYSLTIGSVMTPIGNSQNMLIAIESGVRPPFIEFLKWLAISTLINIYVTALSEVLILVARRNCCPSLRVTSFRSITVCDSTGNRCKIPLSAELNG